MIIFDKDINEWIPVFPAFAGTGMTGLKTL